MLRRFHTVRITRSFCRVGRLCSSNGSRVSRCRSLKEAGLKYGAAVALFYWVTNEMIVCALTYFLHYGYLGKGDLIEFLEYVGASDYINLANIENKNWSLFNNSIVISARFVANFSAASLFMTLWTPLQVPLCIAVYPKFVSLFRR